MKFLELLSIVTKMGGSKAICSHVLAFELTNKLCLKSDDPPIASHVPDPSQVYESRHSSWVRAPPTHFQDL